MRAAIREAVEQLDPAISAKGQSLKVVFAGRNTLVNAGRTRLIQVLVNALASASR